MWHRRAAAIAKIFIPWIIIGVVLIVIVMILSSALQGQEIKLVSPGLINEPGQANLGATPHKLGLTDGSSSSPVTDLQPSISFQRWISTLPYSPSSTPTTIPYQFYCNHLSGPGYVYCGDFWNRLNSRTLNDGTGVSGRVFLEPWGLVSNVSASANPTGGTLAPHILAYYVSALINDVEILGSNHVTVVTTTSTSSVSVSWSDLSGATSYRVYRYLPSHSEVYPVYFETTSTSYIDAGFIGTPGIGLSSTGWGGWFQAWKTAHSSRIAGIEVDAVNVSSLSSPYRVDVAGTSIGAQIVSTGTSNNTAGIHLIGEPDSKFRRGIVLDQNSYSEIGIDLSPGGSNDVPALKLAPGQPLLMSTANENLFSLVRNSSSGSDSLAGFRSQSDTALVQMIAHSTGRTVTRYGISVGGYSEILSTTGNGLLVGTSSTTPVTFGTASTKRMSLTPEGHIVDYGPRVKVPISITITDNGQSGLASTYGLDPRESSLYLLSCPDPDGCTVSLVSTHSQYLLISQELRIISVLGTLTIQDSAPNYLEGNWVGSANDVLDVAFLGDRWVETGRSNN